MKKYVVLLVLFLIVIINGMIIIGCGNKEENSNISTTEPVQVTAYSELSGDEYVVYTNQSKDTKINFSKCSEYTRVLLKNYITNNFSVNTPEDVEWAIKENYAIVYYLLDEQWYVFKIDGDNFKSIKKDGERPYCGVYIKASRAKDALYVDIDTLEKESITDKDFMDYLHKWTKINIKKIYICPGEPEDEYQNIYYKCDGKWYFCARGLSLKTIKENEMLDSSIIEKIEESITK